MISGADPVGARQREAALKFTKALSMGCSQLNKEYFDNFTFKKNRIAPFGKHLSLGLNLKSCFRPFLYIYLRFLKLLTPFQSACSRNANSLNPEKVIFHLWSGTYKISFRFRNDAEFCVSGKGKMNLLMQA